MEGTWQGETFTKGNLYPAFSQEEGGQRAHSGSSVFQLHSAQINQYAKVAYFGVAYLDPIQLFKTKLGILGISQLVQRKSVNCLLPCYLVLR